MAVLKTRTISRRTVEALKVEKDTVFWDSELSGFGVRVYPSGSKVYVVQTRAGGEAAKRVTVGRHGVVTAEEARRRAALIVARIKAGEEPTAEPLGAGPAAGPTVAELARRWLEEHVAVRCKPKTESTYRLMVGKHILPALGKMPALAVEHARVTELHHRLSATPVMANQVVDTLSRIYNAAGDRAQIPEACNPCRLVAKNRERKRERFLTDTELRRLGAVLDEAGRRKGVPEWGGEPPSGGSMTIQRPSGRARLGLHVSPVGDAEADFGGRRVAALVLLVDPARRPRIDAQRVAKTLGLTPSEGRMAALLAEGLKVREIAAAQGWSENYVRWLVQQVYRKQGVSGQVGLVRQVLAADALPKR